MHDDPMAGVPEPRSRFRWQVPWGIIVTLALIPIGAILALLLLA